ncbi:phosphatase PAP2/dual specificity phosphatase family protein [Iodobacter fluviatilis]|uniref:Dual specificity phosphatase, catalytic domain n=1 Tax=Iodobacter fluviatilis TaxID=537 RepID=A0A377Q9I8_9NEIS|nr:phosphatase PAP2/dual specificity phosphatase family protein [Iodobacter fluviatilis]TCU88441.1 dual specificity protein phosphatase-like protein [Iodobacter fluviatilis]STQ91487.1 Dual specificity phosphatase, catalytic domain [Iodobacter fluviatilis]
MSKALNSEVKEPRPWRLALLWLLVLGPGFFIFYGAANHYTASLAPAKVGSIVMSWERHIPLWPWTIVPYWSIDLLYGISLFICTSRGELNTHAKRLLATSLLSCLFFVLFPLRFSFERPELDGFFGQLFTLLMGFDKPFNQAPSLHIGLLTVLWLRYAVHIPARWRPLLHVWFALIGLSVLTTWQHHFWDIPSGFLLGFIVCYLLPSPGVRLFAAKPRQCSPKLALRYFSGALLLSLGIVCLQGWAWLLLWPITSLLILTAAYLGLGPEAMQKDHGQRRFSAQVLLWPYAIVTQQVHRYLLKSLPAAEEISRGVWLGPISAAADPRFKSVLDLAAEYDRQAPAEAIYHSYPLLDLQLPDQQTLQRCVHTLQSMPQPVLVHCALGMTRSAAVLLAWLVVSRQAKDIDEAVAFLQTKRSQFVLNSAQLNQLARLCDDIQ